MDKINQVYPKIIGKFQLGITRQDETTIIILLSETQELCDQFNSLFENHKCKLIVIVSEDVEFTFQFRFEELNIMYKCNTQKSVDDYLQFTFLLDNSQPLLSCEVIGDNIRRYPLNKLHKTDYEIKYGDLH